MSVSPGRLVHPVALVVLLSVVAACSGPSPALQPPAPEKPPCEVAAALRARVPRLMKEGKLHRTGRVIQKANRLCPATAKETWAAEVEVAEALGAPGKYAEAKRLIAAIGATPDAPEAAKAAAKTAAARVLRFDKEWPEPDAVTVEMRKAYEVAEQAAGQGRLEEAIGLYEKAWEAWPPNGPALVRAGFLAKKLGRTGEAQRLFDRVVAVLEARTGQVARAEVPNGLTGDVGALAWSRSGKRLAVAHGTVLSILDAETWNERVKSEGHTGQARAVAFSPDGRRIASGSDDRTVRLWDAQTGAQLLSLSGHVGPVVAVALSPDGKRLASGSEDHRVRLWDAQTGAPLLSFSGHTGKVTAVAFSPDGKRIASGSDDDTVRLWDAQTGTPLFSLEGHGSVTAVAFSPDGKRIASGSDTVRLWDAQRGTPLFSLEGHGSVTAVAFSLDGKRVASASLDLAVQVWDARAGASLYSLAGSADRVSAVALSPDLERVASGAKNGAAQLRDARTGVPLFSLHRHTHKIDVAALSPDAKTVAFGDGTNALWLWDLQAGAPLPPLELSTPGATAVAFSSDSENVFVAYGYSPVWQWSTERKVPLRAFHGHTGLVNAVAFSPDKRRVALGDEGSVRVVDVQTSNPLLLLEGHAGFVNAVAFSPDGKRIVTGGFDNTVRLWDAGTGAALFSLSAHTDSVHAVAFSPDSRRVASAADDDTVRLWDARTGAALFSLSTHGDSVHALAFSPDGAHLVAVSRGGEIRFFRLPGDTPVVVLRLVAGKTTAYPVTPDGHVDFLGPDACYARSLAVCRIGPHVFPFDVCEERFHTPGLLAKILSGDDAYLEPELEHAPLSCPSSAPGIISRVSVPIRIGDPASRVQERYGADAVAQGDGGAGPNWDASVHLEAQGLWFFFKEGKVETIRIEAPFAGEIDGVKIGDSLERLLVMKGQPKDAPFDFAGDDAYVYDARTPSFVRYDVSRTTGRVVTIFL